MSTPADFFRSHGLVVDDPRNDGLWHRVPTVDHPRKKNGAYRWDGEHAYCQNWATMLESASWKDDTVRPITDADRAAAAQKRRDRAITQEKEQQRAAARAEKMLGECSIGTHGYLERKGFHSTPGLVMPDGALFVPMRRLLTNYLAGAQVIRWLPDERVWDKKYLFGQRSQGSVFTIGTGRESFLCEGLATGLSIDAALRSLKLSACVIVTFSAHNLTAVAKMLPNPERAFVYADADAPEADPEKWKRNPGEAGQRAAVASGLRWAMSTIVGFDANDVHAHLGLRTLAAQLMELRRTKKPPTWTPAPEPTEEAQA